MKTFVYREVRPAKHERRRELLSQLALIKKYPDMKDIKRELRQQLRKTEGHTSYFLFHKGSRYFIGNETSKNKFLFAGLSGDLVDYHLREFRARGKKLFAPNKNILIKSIGNYIPLDKTTPGAYVRANKVIRRQKATMGKVPKTRDTYVGIELEYASTLSIQQIAELIADAGLHDSIRVMRDGSIVPEGPFVHQIEFCILAKFSELNSVLEKFKAILDPAKFLANNSCGFHVHLDAREKDVHRMFHNLVCMQSLLFKMAAAHRQESRYCVPISSPNFNEIDETAINAHYDAISKSAYYKHRTIEIRIHESTTDLTSVSKWVTLLKKIADYSGEMLEFASLGGAINQLAKINLEPELVEYVNQKQAI